MSKKLSKSLALEMACDPAYTWLPGVRSLCLGVGGKAKYIALSSMVRHLHSGSEDWHPEAEEAYRYAVWVYRCTLPVVDDDAVAEDLQQSYLLQLKNLAPASAEAASDVLRFFKLPGVEAKVEAEKAALRILWDEHGDNAVTAVRNDTLSGEFDFAEEPDWVGEYASQKIGGIMERTAAKFLRLHDKLNPEETAKYQLAGETLRSIAFSVGAKV